MISLGVGSPRSSSARRDRNRACSSARPAKYGGSPPGPGRNGPEPSKSVIRRRLAGSRERSGTGQRPGDRQRPSAGANPEVLARETRLPGPTGTAEVAAREAPDPFPLHDFGTRLPDRGALTLDTVRTPANDAAFTLRTRPIPPQPRAFALLGLPPSWQPGADPPRSRTTPRTPGFSAFPVPELPIRIPVGRGRRRLRRPRSPTPGWVP